MMRRRLMLGGKLPLEPDPTTITWYSTTATLATSTSRRMVLTDNILFNEEKDGTEPPYIGHKINIIRARLSSNLNTSARVILGSVNANGEWTGVLFTSNKKAISSTKSYLGKTLDLRRGYEGKRLTIFNGSSSQYCYYINDDTSVAMTVSNKSRTLKSSTDDRRFQIDFGYDPSLDETK